MDRVREVYERAIAQVPPAQEKRLWRRYIYLWIKYALFEELETKVSVEVAEEELYRGPYTYAQRQSELTKSDFYQ